MSILTDVRYALRRFQAAPGFVAVAGLTLALGIGATTAIYSVVDTLMLRPLPYPNPEGLVELNTRSAAGRGGYYFNREQLAALEARTDLFAGVAVFDYRSGTLASSREPALDAGLAVGGTLMPLLDVAPWLGRTIQPGDTKPGAAPVIVLSHAAWQEKFGGDPAIIGKAITLEGKLVEVVGVMPKSFAFADSRRSFWVPLTEGAFEGRVFQAMARVRPELSAAEALARIAAITVTRSGANGIETLKLESNPMGARRLNPPVRTALLVLAGAVSLVLLIACANIANLLLVQNAGRAREVAVRSALGASRARLLRQLFTEAALLAVIGGGLGLIVAQWAIELLAAMAPDSMTYFSTSAIALDRRVLLFAGVVTCLTGLVFSLLPAIKSSRTGVFDALKAGARSATQTGHQERLRRVFIVMQLAVSCLLLVGASLLTRTFVHMTRLDPGFAADRIAMTTLQLPTWKYRTGTERGVFYDTLVERIATLPGVAGAVRAGGLPPYGGNIDFNLVFEVEGKGVVLKDPSIELPNMAVPPNFFSVLGIPFKMGQTFADYAIPGAEPVAVISEHLAQRLWGSENPVGRRFRMGIGPKDPWYTVVGVVGGVYQFRYEKTTDQLAYYVPARRDVSGAVQSIVVRTNGDPSALVPRIREQIRALDPEQPIWRLGTVESQYSEFFALPRFYMFVMTTFAAIGLVIAGVGLYGVLAYAIAQRTRELGVRLALGATEVGRDADGDASGRHGHGAGPARRHGRQPVRDAIARVDAGRRAAARPDLVRDGGARPAGDRRRGLLDSGAARHERRSDRRAQG